MALSTDEKAKLSLVISGLFCLLLSDSPSHPELAQLFGMLSALLLIVGFLGFHHVSVFGGYRELAIELEKRHERGKNV